MIITKRYSIDYDVANSEVFADICDGQMLELTTNWRAQNDPEFAEFINDLRMVKEGGTPNYKHNNNECKKSLCWTNKTRIIINNNG